MEEQSERAATPAGSASRGRPLVEILFFAGCPNHVGAIALVERVSGEIGLDPVIRILDVPDQEAAQRLRFLGSPTIRVNGRDVDPTADQRRDYGLTCRLYLGPDGMRGTPPVEWVLALLRQYGSEG